MIRVAVVDDEPLARSGVRARLARHPDMHLVGEYTDGKAALDGILETPPDLVLLDIQMPNLDGLGLLAEIPQERRPMIVFLTAHDNFAVRAFDLKALDYILKPIDDDRFSESLDRAREAIASRHRSGATALDLTQGGHRQRFPIRTGRRVTFIDAADVEWIEASGDYAILHSGRKEHLLRESLADLARQLDPATFIRAHRSTIVRLDCVAEMQALPNRDALIRLRDGTPLRVSRTYIANFLERLHERSIRR
ncbi:LytR/AlgR family response regulator transcription factor [Pseudoxanthomonas sacheonensis]|uniref:LytR/AlgR family response regulator transcription factor n=1 Tax=Pseudoxanthomonas sacheonensis TaxID=443615 RepID=UPI0013D25E99|nr:LytTR family DNA-binding domain-containing protein [Pseudoxanthomonas sacheonensis]KAF1708677.1 DNA-binding response regulator [Pseudoxanthomonas sacheonensis]